MQSKQRPLLTLVDIVAHLRGPEGCPWDKSQTLSSMRPYLLEEVYELLDAMEHDSGEDGLEGELGDTLFVILLLTQIASDAGDLTLDTVCERITNKMITRHPHVFGDEQDSDDPGGIAAWESRKNKEGRSRLSGVPRSLPALLRAHRQGEKVAAVGFDWANADGVLAKLEEEIAELREALASQNEGAIEHEYGDVLMAAANLGRHIDSPPEAALRRANDRFADRFDQLEQLARLQGITLDGSTDESQLNTLWEQVKEGEKKC
mgnify:CR=1 FL=1